MDKARLDKYLWSIRVFKTRSDAADACKSGKIKVNNVEAKASKEIKAGDLLDIRKINIIYSYKVIEPVDKRQGAKLVPNFALDITSPEELEKLNAPIETIFIKRDRGTGRPTKKERRDLEDIMEY